MAIFSRSVFIFTDLQVGYCWVMVFRDGSRKTCIGGVCVCEVCIYVLIHEAKEASRHEASSSQQLTCFTLDTSRARNQGGSNKLEKLPSCRLVAVPAGWLEKSQPPALLLCRNFFLIYFTKLVYLVYYES